MPNPTYRVSVIGRGGERSAVGMAAYGSGKTLRVQSVVAAASYRSGEPLHDQKQGRIFDYSGREDVVHTAILAPEHLQHIKWIFDRESLWNAVETKEKRADAQLARSIIIAMPRELNLEQNIALLHAHVKEQFVSLGMVADLAIHNKIASDGLDNPHAHILLTVREINTDGTWARAKNRSWDGRDHAYGGKGNVTAWRDAWENIQNSFLGESGSHARIDMRSYEAQGANRVPTVHMGAQVIAMELKGIETDIGNYNYKVTQQNAMREMVDAMQPQTNDIGLTTMLDATRIAEHEAQQQEYEQEIDAGREHDIEH